MEQEAVALVAQIYQITKPFIVLAGVIVVCAIVGAILNKVTP